MTTFASREPDRERARHVAENGCILRSLVGSTVHGLTNAGTDDRDEMGVCVEPREYVLGLREFEHYTFRTQPEGHPSGPGDLDLTIYGLRKFARLALKGSPTVLLLFHVPDDALVTRTELGEELQALGPAFLSRRTGAAFLGYCDAQLRGLTGERHATRTRERSADHGYDTKYAMHALRIAFQGTSLLRDGAIPMPVGEPERSRLMQVRRGELPLEEVMSDLEAAIGTLKALADATTLPEHADRDRVDAFLASAYERSWTSS